MRILREILDRYFAEKVARCISINLSYGKMLCVRTKIDKKETKILVKNQKWADEYYKEIYSFSNKDAVEEFIFLRTSNSGLISELYDRAERILKE